jgi:hypothetical protein
LAPQPSGKRRKLAGDLQRLWNPAEWQQLDAEPDELLRDGLAETWRILQREWEAAATDKEPRALLLKALRGISPERLQAAGFHRDVVVFAVDDELVDLDRNVSKIIPARRRRELESQLQSLEARARAQALVDSAGGRRLVVVADHVVHPGLLGG